MGAGPDLGKIIATSTTAKAAVDAAVADAEKQLNNTKDAAIAYISSNTKGLKEIEQSNFNSYYKYSEEYSLDALDGIVDGLIKGAQDYLNPAKDPNKASDMAGDLGQVVKATLALFASSSTTSQTLQVVFSHIISGGQQYAMYYATNSMEVAGQNAWGNKAITVVSNTYILAIVEPNTDVTVATVLQQNLDTIVQLNAQYDQAIIAATNEKQLRALKLNVQKMKMVEKNIKKELAGNLVK